MRGLKKKGIIYWRERERALVSRNGEVNIYVIPHNSSGENHVKVSKCGGMSLAGFEPTISC